MDEFEHSLARRLREGGEIGGGVARYQAVIAGLRRRRGAMLLATSLLGLSVVGAVLTSGYLLAARALPTPDGPLTALLWAPPGAAALLVLLALGEVLRAVR